MNELIARAMQGVDPDDPGATWLIFQRLMAMVPWWQMVAWQVVFIVVGAALGAWKGRLKATLIASLVFGPLGWVVPFLPGRPRQPPPLPGSKKR